MNRNSISSQLPFYFIVSAVTTFLCLAILWWYYYWTPDISSQDVQSFLLTLVQTLAGILAIAVSFSLLYVQISVDSYSLRASSLLVQQIEFKALIRNYVLLLLFLSFMSLFVTDHPQWLPPLFGGLGVISLFSALFSLTRYVEAIANFITPESIINHIVEQIDRDSIRRHAFQILAGNSYRDFHTGKIVYESIRILRFPFNLMHYHDTQRLLVDITRRMIRNSDHIVTRLTMNALMGERVFYSQSKKQLIYSSELLYFNIEDVFTEREILRDGITKELLDSAIIAYHAGMLTEIWSIALIANDQISASQVLTSFGCLIHEYDPRIGFRREVFSTDIFDANWGYNGIIIDVFFKDSSHPGWKPLRQQLIDILLLPLGVNKKYDEHWPEITEGFPILEQLGPLFSLLWEIDRFLLKEDDPDLVLERSVSRGMIQISQLAMKVHKENLLLDTYHWISERHHLGNSPAWHKVFHFRSGEEIAKLLEEITLHWFEGIVEGIYSWSGSFHLEGAIASYFEISQQVAKNEVAVADTEYANALTNILIASLDANCYDWVSGIQQYLPYFGKEASKSVNLVANSIAKILFYINEENEMKRYFGFLNHYLTNEKIEKNRSSVHTILKAIQRVDAEKLFPAHEKLKEAHLKLEKKFQEFLANLS